MVPVIYKTKQEIGHGYQDQVLLCVCSKRN
jgi:hypothetical protein